jgi:tetratricopeptide (TPR) repeat protein
MLRILARARGLAQGQPGCTRERLTSALVAQLQDFPSDPSSNEARWLLGKMRLAAGEREEAIALWKAIPHGQPRWLDARLAFADYLQDGIDDLLPSGDLRAARDRFEAARAELASAQAEANDSTERAGIALAVARLELTPRIGDPEKARVICERLLQATGQGNERAQARSLWVVALAELAHFVDAEREVRAIASQRRDGELLPLIRLLDQAAELSDSDVSRRRYGQLMRSLMLHVPDGPGAQPSGDHTETRLRLIRAWLYTGHFDDARQALRMWPGGNQAVPDALLDPLADAYMRLEAFGLAVDVYRLRVQQTRPGSIPWFVARYSLALAFYRAGKPQEARRLIDATAILHPELGGDELRTKFERLRQRLDHE